MKKTTLYNHVHIGTEDKPLIPNIIFKVLCDILLKNNEQTLSNEILNIYTLEKSQKDLYEYLNFKYNNIQPIGKTFI